MATLRRGFVQAGARNLVLTLWPIDDREVALEILEFYRAAQRTDDLRHALAEVERNWMQRLRKERGVAEAVRLGGPLILSYEAGTR